MKDVLKEGCINQWVYIEGKRIKDATITPITFGVV